MALYTGVDRVAYTYKNGHLNSVNLEVTYGAKSVPLKFHHFYKEEELKKLMEKDSEREKVAKEHIASFTITICRSYKYDSSQLESCAYSETLSKDGYFYQVPENMPNVFNVAWFIQEHPVLLRGRAYMPGVDGDIYIKDGMGVLNDNPRYQVPAFPVDKTIKPHTELNDWREIADPARALLNGFVVNEIPNETK